MELQDNINIDLVFKCSKSVHNLTDFNSKENNLIFTSSFWEKIFSIWIKIIIDEKIKIPSSVIYKKNTFSLSFEIINNQEISIINNKWLNKKGPTDVISFPIILKKELANDLNFIELGDLFISLEMASKQALEFDNSLKKEMLFLASHGLLHLLGWEHEGESQLKSMLNLQEYLISQSI